MKRTTRIIIWTAVALPLLTVAFYIRYRPELEDRLLPPLINIKSPLNGSTLKNVRVKVEICCERVRARGYSLTANLNGNRINHKLGVRGSCFSGIVKCDSGYNHLKVELYRQNRLLSHAISRFTVSPAKPVSREETISGLPSEQGAPSAPGREEIGFPLEEKLGADVSFDKLRKGPGDPSIVAEAPLAPGEDSRTGGEGASGILFQDRDETGEEEPPEPPTEEEPPEPPTDEEAPPTEEEPPEPPPEEEPPVELFIDIRTPVCGSLTNQPVQDVSGSASLGMQVTLVNPRTGGLLVTLAAGSGEYLFPAVAFNEGLNRVMVTVSDPEGRTVSAPACSLLVDTTPPLITIDNPRDTSIHSTLRLNVYGSTEPNTLVEIVDPYTSTRSDGLGNFSFPQVEFKEGSNSLTVRATDAAGNIGTETVNFRIDITRPEITCDNGLECSRNVGPFGRTEPNSTVLWLDQGLQIMSDAEGNFAFPDILFPEGENNIGLRATDPAGNSFDAVCTIEIDTTPPVVTIINPRDCTGINPCIQDVTGRTEPLSTVEISDPLGGESMGVTSCEAGSFVFPGVAFLEGTNTLTVKATDRCGWEGTATIDFYCWPDFARVAIDYCDPSLENPLDLAVVNQINMCVFVNLPDRECRSGDYDFLYSLGAYHFYLSFDPGVVRLQRVAGGDAIEFRSVSARVSNAINPDTGLATSFFFEANNGRTNWEAPSGMGINVARLTFDVVGSGTSTLALRIRTLSDNDRQPIGGFVRNGFVEIQ